MHVKKIHRMVAIMSDISETMGCKIPKSEQVQDINENDACINLNEICWERRQLFCVKEIHQKMSILSAILDNMSCRTAILDNMSCRTPTILNTSGYGSHQNLQKWLVE